jgi:hypothetical protein
MSRKSPGSALRNHATVASPNPGTLSSRSCRKNCPNSASSRCHPNKPPIRLAANISKGCDKTNSAIPKNTSDPIMIEPIRQVGSRKTAICLASFRAGFNFITFFPMMRVICKPYRTLPKRINSLTSHYFDQKKIRCPYCCYANIDKPPGLPFRSQ